MRRDHRPYWMRQVFAGVEAAYARRFLLPHFDAAGRGPAVSRPWHVNLFGPNITMGDHVELRATAEAPIRLTTWQHAEGTGAIHLGHCSLIGPGCRLMAAERITLGQGVMLAPHVVISDADWHDQYDRTQAPGRRGAVVLEEDAWIGDGALIGKGVHIGARSIVGARAVVTRDVPPDTIVAGNPAQVVRSLDPDCMVTGRRTLYADPAAHEARFDALYRLVLNGNSTWGWLRQRLFPNREV